MVAHDNPSSGRPGRWSTIVAWGLAIVAVAGFVVAAVNTNSTTVVRTVIERVPTTIGSVRQDAPAGALAAAQTFWADSDAATSPVDSWTLEYRLDTYTPGAATLEGWGVARDSSGTRWQTVTVTVRYLSGRWQPPATAAGIEVALDPSLDPSSRNFAAAIASFHRLPGTS